MGRRKKNLLGELDIDGTNYSCSRWESWPPIEIIMHEDPQTVRLEMGNAAYHRVQVWEAACGLMKMDPGKCPSCPYVEVDGLILKAPGGGFHIPRTIAATRMAAMRKRAKKK